VIKSLAYLNYGNWVVDCPAEGCSDARAVYDPRTGQRHSEDVCARGHAFQIVMPPPQEEARIVQALAERANDKDKAWFPAGHGWATAAGYPTGQSLEQLLEENREVAAQRAGEDDAKRDQILATLAGLGIEVRPDGTFTGSI
jgi:hypothetical protein